MIPVGYMQLRRAIWRARRAPCKLITARREYWQNVCPVCVGHSNRCVRTLGINQEKFEISVAQLIARVDKVFAARMIIRRPRNHCVGGELTLIAAIGVHRPDFCAIAIGIKASPSNFTAVWAKEWSAIIAR